MLEGEGRSLAELLRELMRHTRKAPPELNKAFEEIANEIERRLEQGEEANRAIEELKSAVEEAKNSLASLASNVNNLGRRLSAVENRLDSVESRVASVGKTAGKLEENLGQRLNDLAERVTMLEANYSTQQLGAGMQWSTAYAALASITRCVYEKIAETCCSQLLGTSHDVKLYSMIMNVVETNIKLEVLESCLESLLRDKAEAETLYRAAGCPQKCCQQLQRHNFLKQEAFTALLDELKRLPQAVVMGRGLPSERRIAIALALLLC